MANITDEDLDNILDEASDAIQDEAAGGVSIPVAMHHYMINLA